MGVLVRSDELRKPIEGRFGNTPLGRVIDVDDSKAARKAGAPLEIIQKRPEKIATHIRAGSNSFLQRLGIGGKIGNAPAVVHPARFIQRLVCSVAILRNADRKLVAPAP